MRTIKVEISVKVPDNYEVDETLVDWAQVGELLSDMDDRYSDVEYLEGKIISDTKEP